MKRKLDFTTQLYRLAFLLPAMLSLSACSEKMAPASINGYNHSKVNPISNFTVNGAMGMNLNQESGGGGESCCVSIPYNWRPGLKARITWKYDTEQTDPNPPPPSQEIDIDIPEYKKPGRFQVHFYDNHKIKVVISGCSIGHPFYPMSKQDKLPWEDDFNKEEAIEVEKRGGGRNDC